MKKSIYDKLEDIPQIDRDENNYVLNQTSGSPNFGKYVLALDGAHPVQLKNNEILTEKRTAESTHQTAMQQKDGEISRLTGELNTAKSQSGLPAGQIAVPADTLTVLNNYKTLGEFDQVKAKVEEHGTLKEQTEAQGRRDLYAEVAKTNGFDEKAFAKLAEPLKLNERLESREIDDGKGNMVKHFFVKGKDNKGAETSTAVNEFVKKDGDFQPFLNSLVLSDADRKRLPVPNQKHGDPPSDKSPADSYLGSTYKRPDAAE